MNISDYIPIIEFPKVKPEEVWKRIEEMCSDWEGFDQIREDYRKALLEWDSKKK